MGHTPSTAGTFRKKFRKDSGKTPETLSERFLEFPSRVRLGSPKPYHSRHLRLPEHFQNSLTPSTDGDASFFGVGSGEGLSEPVMEFSAVLGGFLIPFQKSLLAKPETVHFLALCRPCLCPDLQNKAFWPRFTFSQEAKTWKEKSLFFTVLKWGKGRNHYENHDLGHNH